MEEPGVVAGCDEDGVNTTPFAGELIAAHAVLRLAMADHGSVADARSKVCFSSQAHPQVASAGLSGILCARP